MAQDRHLSDRLDSLLASEPRTDGPGFAVGIVQNGALTCFRSAGMSDIVARTAFTDSTVFGIASITKQFTAACIWSLVRQGQLSLDDDLRTHLPELPDLGEPIRIRHALNHTSGIRNYHALMDLAGFNYDSAFHDNSTILELACRQRALNNRPGEQVVYGNTAYTLLAILIERASGQDLNAYAQEHLFAPLGMSDTFYRIDMTAVAQNRAHGYTLDADGRCTEVARTQCTYGAGGMASSVRDLAKWAAVINGRNAAFRDLATFLTAQDSLLSGEPASYSRGIMVNEHRGVRTIHHSGYAQGGRSQMISVPERDLSIIVLTNTDAIDPEPWSYRIIDLFLDDAPETALPVTSAPVHTTEVRSFAGHFQELNSDMVMDIRSERDTLWAQGAQARKPTALTAQEWGCFHRANNPHVRYVFDTLARTEHDLTIYFGATPFYFARTVPADPAHIHVQDFTGRFRSHELDVTYDLRADADILYLSYPHHAQMALSPRQIDAFGNDGRVLYRFTRNARGAVDGLRVSSEGTVKDIVFVREP